MNNPLKKWLHNILDWLHTAIDWLLMALHTALHWLCMAGMIFPFVSVPLYIILLLVDDGMLSDFIWLLGIALIFFYFIAWRRVAEYYGYQVEKLQEDGYHKLSDRLNLILCLLFLMVPVSIVINSESVSDVAVYIVASILGLSSYSLLTQVIVFGAVFILLVSLALGVPFCLYWVCSFPRRMAESYHRSQQRLLGIKERDYWERRGIVGKDNRAKKRNA